MGARSVGIAKVDNIRVQVLRETQLSGSELLAESRSRHLDEAVI